MVKIKRKVEMTLPELIEWGFKNNVKDRGFSCNQATHRPVVFDSIGWIDFIDDYCYPPGDTYTVEVEEEITKETELPKYLEIFAYEDLDYGDESSFIGENQSIKEILQENENCSSITKTIHLVNDDGTHTLIWKDGELVGDE